MIYCELIKFIYLFLAVQLFVLDACHFLLHLYVYFLYFLVYSAELDRHSSSTFRSMEIAQWVTFVHVSERSSKAENSFNDHSTHLLIFLITDIPLSFVFFNAREKEKKLHKCTQMHTLMYLFILVSFFFFFVILRIDFII